ncbi:MAG: hypothetical protein ACRDF4_00030 [Rhabdochlamydiaceae bacterium]
MMPKNWRQALLLPRYRLDMRLLTALRNWLFENKPLVLMRVYADQQIRLIDEWLDKGRSESELAELGRDQSATLTKDELRIILEDTNPKADYFSLKRKLLQTEGELRPKIHTAELWRESMRLVADAVNDCLVNYRDIDMHDQSNPWRLMACAELQSRTRAAYAEAEHLFESRLNSYHDRRKRMLSKRKLQSVTVLPDTLLAGRASGSSRENVIKSQSAI